MTAVKTRAAASGIGRKRDRELVDALIRHTAMNEGQLTPEVARAAIAETWLGRIPKTKESAWEIVRKKLRNPNIRQALGEIYEELGDGFTIEDAVKKHVWHIKKGSYAALKDFLTMTLPMPAKKLEVGMTVASIGASMLNSVPPVEARALGPAQVEDVIDAPIVDLGEAEEDG